MQEGLTDWLLVHYGQEQMRPGLERIKRALTYLLPKYKNSKIIIVAGTNGKGETSLRLSALLKDRPHYVWISPHIERITERFRNEGGEIELEKLNSLIQFCHKQVQREKFELSFYEFLFFVFCTWCSESHPEFLILEVGLGGRLDAVNAFDADMVLLPSLSRDHQEILGHRYDQILKEKLGTLREKSTLIHFLPNNYLSERAQTYAQSVGAKVIALKESVTLPDFEFSLRNKALATAAYCHLTGRAFIFSEGKDQASFLEHRGEVQSGKNEWVFFGSHNVDGMRKLIQFLHSGTYNFSRPPYDVVIVAFSRRNLQDLRLMTKMLKQAGIGKIVGTVFDHPKAASRETMEALSSEEGFIFVQDISIYVKSLLPGQRVLVTGSYYFIGHVKSLPGR